MLCPATPPPRCLEVTGTRSWLQVQTLRSDLSLAGDQPKPWGLTAAGWEPWDSSPEQGAAPAFVSLALVQFPHPPLFYYEENQE